MKKIFLLCMLLSLLGSELMAQAAGRAYRDHCYNSTGQTFYPGNYYQNQLSVGNDKISSVNMYNNNHFIRLYEHNNFWGEYRDVYSDMNDLTSIGFGDKTSSIKVLPNYYGPVTSNEPIISANILNGQFIYQASSTNYSIHEDELYNVSRLHMQGLGQNSAKNRIILTGCAATSKNSGCTGASYLLLFNNNGTFLDFLVAKRYNGQTWGASHPSSIQVINDVFPVAVAESSGETGPSRIEFYTIQNDQIVLVPNSQKITIYDHIGTLAYANIDGNTYMIGADYDAKNLYVWRSIGENRTTGFTALATNHNPNNSIVNAASIDENWGGYNSFWLGKMVEDGRIVLFGTHGKFLDVWEVGNIDSHYNLSLRKIHKRERQRKYSWSIQYFREGTLPIHRPGNTPDVLTFPFDFVKPLFSDYLQAPLLKFRYYSTNCSDNAPSDPKTEPMASKVKQDEISTNLDINSKENLSDLSLYSNVKLSINPNPVSGRVVNVSFNGLTTDHQVTQLRIFDFNGRLVREVNVQDAVTNPRRVLDISNLDEGPYAIQLIGESGILASQKFIKIND